MATVDVHDLESAMLLLDADQDAQAWICRSTGAVLIRSDEIGEPAVVLPDNVDDDAYFTPIPCARRLDLGRQLVFGFVQSEMPDEYDAVHQLFRHPGAYGRYSRLLDRLGLRDRWHRYRDEQTRAALRAWCEDHGFSLKD